MAVMMAESEPRMRHATAACVGKCDGCGRRMSAKNSKIAAAISSAIGKWTSRTCERPKISSGGGRKLSMACPLCMPRWISVGGDGVRVK